MKDEGVEYRQTNGVQRRIIHRDKTEVCVYAPKEPHLPLFISFLEMHAFLSCIL